MDYFTVTRISAAGMSAQQARLEAAALNLANMHTTVAPGTEGYRPVRAVIRPVRVPFAHTVDKAAAVMLATASLVAQDGVATRKAFEPGHPHADASGMVTYPGVDHTSEMLTVMAAMRAYEANLAVLQTTKALAAKTLEIGSR